MAESWKFTIEGLAHSNHSKRRRWSHNPTRSAIYARVFALAKTIGGGRKVKAFGKNTAFGHPHKAFARKCPLSLTKRKENEEEPELEDIEKKGGESGGKQ
jgi:hypothetical protein